MKKKGRKRSCIYEILLTATVCLMASGCASSPTSGGNAVSMKGEDLFPSVGKWEEEAVLKIGKEGTLQDAKVIEPQEADPPSEEEIQALGIPEDMLAYWMVLNNKKPFISTDEDGQEFYWNEYFWFLGEVDARYHADSFMVVDMDGDGGQEVVLYCGPLGATHVLHYEEGEVYSYQFGFRGMKRIHENGIYEGSGGASNTSYYRLTELNKEGYTEEQLAKFDHYDNYYEVEGKEVTQEELSDYVTSYIESSELVENLEFTEEMLDGQFLGNLTEQELALVKRIPAEDMLESEPDYQEHRKALQLYARVLKGEEDVIFVPEDSHPEEGEAVRIYFSLVDMDGDGIQELVFSCYYLVTQILHYKDGKVYCYQLETDAWDTDVITTDGVFKKGSPRNETYARITSFEEDGCRIEPVEGYDISKHERIRYYFYSEDAIAQWLD